MTTDEQQEMKPTSIESTVGRHQQALEAVADALRIIDGQNTKHRDALRVIMPIVAMLVLARTQDLELAEVMAKYSPGDVLEAMHEELSSIYIKSGAH